MQSNTSKEKIQKTKRGFEDTSGKGDNRKFKKWTRKDAKRQQVFD